MKLERLFMGNNSIWNIKNEDRQINFLFDLFMKDREINRIYQRDESINGGIEEIARTLDQIIEIITEKDNPIEFKFLIRELEDRNINFKTEETREKAYVKKLMLAIFDDQCISSNYFSWIDLNNDRVCNFVYSYILCSTLKDNKLECWQKITTNKNSNTQNNSTPIKFLSSILDRKTKYIHEKLNRSQSTSTNKNKIKYIITFFDLLDLNLIIKHEILDDVKSKWDNQKNNNQMLEWLIKNELIIPWAWDYTLDNCLNKTMPNWASLTATTDMELIEAKKVALTTLYDLLDEAYQELFLKKIQTNGSQKKYRNKSLDRKPSSIPLTEKHKGMLKKLAENENQTQYFIIERLIEEAYKKSF